MPNILSMQKHAEKLIRGWGMSQRGQIYRDGALIASPYMGFKEFRPNERGLFGDDARNIAVSAVGLPEIDFETDRIVFLGKTYKIVAPVRGGRPDGTVIYHDVAGVQIKGSA